MSRNLTIAALLLAFPVAARAQSDSGQTYLDFQVEQPVRVRNAVAPVYPPRLRRDKTVGEVVVQFVVDERGSAQMNSFKVIRSNDAEFSEAVRRAVSMTQFIPAEIGGRKVRMLVQQPFHFAVAS